MHIFAYITLIGMLALFTYAFIGTFFDEPPLRSTIIMGWVVLTTVIISAIVLI